jgi:membrane-associated phospholipid phosphatase
LVSLGALAVQLSPFTISKSLIRKRAPGDPRKVNALDRTAIGWHSRVALELSLAGTTLAVALPAVIDWLDVGENFATLLEDAIVLGEAVAADGLLNTIVKYAVRRPLPEVYAGQAPELEESPRGYRAFFSGHVSATASLALSAAITLRLRHPQLKWPFIASGALISVVAFGRVFAGKHFWTDVITGAVVGATSAFGFARLHRRGHGWKPAHRW